MTIVTVMEICIYPIKSCSPIRLESSALDEFGLAYDRIYMLVEPIRNKANRWKVMSQKRYAKMARLHQIILHETKPPSERIIRVTNSDSGEFIDIPLVPNLEGRPLNVTEMPVCPQDIFAPDMGDDFAAFFTNFMSRECRLAYRDPRRIVYGDLLSSIDLDWSSYLLPRKLVTANTDAAPLHFITEESLRELSRSMGMVVTSTRFRPNLVFRGVDEPWEEETWKLIEVEGVGKVSVTARQPRCSVPDVDPETGKNDRANKPSAYLQKHHRTDPSPVWGHFGMFGMMAIHHKSGGVVKIGCQLRILRRGEHCLKYP